MTCRGELCRNCIVACMQSAAIREYLGQRKIPDVAHGSATLSETCQMHVHDVQAYFVQRYITAPTYSCRVPLYEAAVNRGREETVERAADDGSIRETRLTGSNQRPYWLSGKRSKNKVIVKYSSRIRTSHGIGSPRPHRSGQQDSTRGFLVM